jgi:hypothetical protein
MNNLNVSFWGWLTFVAYFLITGFFLRFLSSKYPDSPLSKAIMFING